MGFVSAATGTGKTEKAPVFYAGTSIYIIRRISFKKE
jgi:hypothetical protein